MSIHKQRNAIFLDVIGVGPRWVRRGLAEAGPAIALPVAESAPAPMAKSAEEASVTNSAWDAESSPPLARRLPEEVSPLPSDVAVAAMNWQQLKAAVSSCVQCGLCNKRSNTVFGVGDEKAKWLFIGEGPGRNEDAQGEPFVGPAGKLLDNMLQSLGVKRGANAYIANIVKCRPTDASGKDRPPTAEEAAACLPYLQRQIALIRPTVIVALGKTAALALLKRDPETAVSSLRGTVHRYGEVPLIVTYHPAYLLRSPADKRKTWTDLCLAMTTVAAPNPVLSFQTEFEQRRGHLHDPHVRDLAWLLDSPNLLDSDAPQWHGKIASLFDHQGTDIDQWLIDLDRAPHALHALIASHSFARLGRYAELLMAFFFRWKNILYAHGLQVRAGKNDTIGEFDFLLTHNANTDAKPLELLHWEFATKFYLLESSGFGRDADALVGPNLADSLGAKMRKILDRQLSLSLHPAAQIHLPHPVSSAQALVKGWLFYPRAEWLAGGMAAQESMASGISIDHCNGYWCALSDAPDVAGALFQILPRLSWLAPARSPLANCIDKSTLRAALDAHFEIDPLPVMVATMAPRHDMAVELERGFIVPNDWRQRASAFVQNS